MPFGFSLHFVMSTANPPGLRVLASTRQHDGVLVHSLHAMFRKAVNECEHYKLDYVASACD